MYINKTEGFICSRKVRETILYESGIGRYFHLNNLRKPVWRENILVGLRLLILFMADWSLSHCEHKQYTCHLPKFLALLLKNGIMKFWCSKFYCKIYCKVQNLKIMPISTLKLKLNYTLTFQCLIFHYIFKIKVITKF